MEITDEMVERAHVAWEKSCALENRSVIREVLEAALRPPPQNRRCTDTPREERRQSPSGTEIPVSEGMIEAAWKGVIRWSAVHTDAIAEKYAESIAADIYRAMESKRREEEQEKTPRSGRTTTHML